MVLGVSLGSHKFQVAPNRLDGGLQELQGVVDDVRTPVEQLAAAELREGLPVVAPLEAVAGQLHFVDPAQFSGGDNVADLGESGFKTAVVTDEDGAGAALFSFPQTVKFSHIGGHGLFAENFLSGVEGLKSMVHMVERAGSHGNQFHFGVSQKIFVLGVVSGVGILFFCLGDLFGIPVASGDKFKFIFEHGKFSEVHTSSGSSETENTDFDLF